MLILYFFFCYSYSFISYFYLFIIVFWFFSFYLLSDYNFIFFIMKFFVMVLSRRLLLIYNAFLNEALHYYVFSFFHYFLLFIDFIFVLLTVIIITFISLYRYWSDWFVKKNKKIPWPLWERNTMEKWWKNKWKKINWKVEKMKK